jgi:ADP-glucose pyrophosphorylase
LVREGARWYQGTADTVRQNLRNFLERPYEYYLVLSGDHLYRMDYGDLLHEHVSVLMGAGYYQAEAWEPKPDVPPLGIGRHCYIEGAIIDKNARIGEGVVITPNGKPANMDVENYCIRDGVVMVTKGAMIPN